MWCYLIPIGGCPRFFGGGLCPPIERKGGMAMVTYDGLFQLGILIVAIVSLVYQIAHKK